MLANFVLQPFLMFSMTFLWGMINGLQLVVVLMLMNIPMPGHLLMVDSKLWEIANFTFIPVQYPQELLVIR